MIIDSLMTVGASRFGFDLPAATAVEHLRSQGIALALAAPAHPVDHDFARANVQLAESSIDSAGRLVGLCRVDPWDGEAALELLEGSIRNRGMRGLFLNPEEERFRINDARLRPIAELAQALSVPVVVEAGYPWLSEPSQIAQFARWCPEIAVVMTNGGQFNISGLSQIDAEGALALPNVHIQTSGVYREDFLQKVVANYGADRVLFATAAPYFDPGYEKLRVSLLHVAEEHRQDILGGNARGLFSLG